jgi:hypothetical protein
VINFSNDSVQCELPTRAKPAAFLAGTHTDAPASARLTLAGNEARLYRLA